MASPSGRRAYLFGLAAVAILAAATAGFFALRHWLNAPRDPSLLQFRECAADVGITWKMQFLPNEQGEKFKINLYDHGCGLAVGDYDGDGRDDIYFVNQLGPNALYRNNGDGTFADVTDQAGVALGDRVCVAATFVDYDNDGRQDLYVTSTRGGNVLFRNLGDGTFRDVTKEAGLEHIGHSQTALFFDYDNDGHLDLFLTNTAQWTTDTRDPNTRAFVGKGDLGGLSKVVTSPKEFNVLYRNTGKGTFVDVTEQAGLKGRGWAGDAIAFDYNGDGRMDLFVTSMFGRAQLYRNDGGKFTDVTLDVLGKTPWGGVGARLFDFNNDGRLDLYVLDMHSDMWMGVDKEHESLELARKHIRKKFNHYNGPMAEKDLSLIKQEQDLGRQIGFKHEECLFGNACYRNDGNGKFTEVSDQAGLETFWPWGVATGDFDNDGYEDAFVPAGMGYPFYYWPNSLLMNQRNGTFVDQAAELGVEPPRRGMNLPDRIGGKDAARSSRCAVTGDFDGDGRLEVVVNNFNDQPYYLKNQFPQKNYVAFRLIGGVSNRDGIGAIVRLYKDGKVMTRQVQGAGGYLSQSSKVVHFGLGDTDTFDKVEVTWPSGRKQTLDGATANQRHDVLEMFGGKK
jgi:enediyne biosynthesis protein E4